MNLESTTLGIEFGSTRIKAVLIDESHVPVASGSFEWENKLVNGIWTYSQKEIHSGLQKCYSNLKKDVKEKYGILLKKVGAIGVSAMMHGYLPFDKDGKQLCEFRTWRNTITGEAAEKLSEAFDFNIPQRWSIAHLYQAVLNGEKHINDIAHLTTLAGYIHFKLTGENVMGIGEASGMFPIDSEKLCFDEKMLDKFDSLHSCSWQIRDILPKILCAGENGGFLTADGAAFLDIDGDLISGIPVAPCEGDAGTGMVATNSVRVNTGNVSAGTSDFAMIVTDKKLKAHREIDMVTTPSGKPVAMVHCNNCTSDINAWAKLFSEFADAIGMQMSRNKVLDLMFSKALEGDSDCGGLLNYNYFSGEGVTDIDEGRPLFVRTPESRFNLPNFMRTQILSSLATLKIGLDILINDEGVEIDKIYGHGGFFKAPEVGQKMLSAAINAPVSVMETAGEGGPYGMALLCAYMIRKEKDETLEDYLENKVFKNAVSVSLMADKNDIDGFNRFLETYKKAFVLEKNAVEVLPCLKN